MKKKIYLSFGLLLGVFLVGSIIAVAYITKTAHRMDRVIMLHQVEILREDLIIREQQVQSHLYRNKNRSDRDVDALIAQVDEMDRVMESCAGCHHSPELTQGILGMHDTANDYKEAISQLITASANPARLASLERRAQDLGQDLITMTQGMAFTANVRLQEKTQDTIARIGEVRTILSATLLLGFLLAIAIAVFLARKLDQQRRQLLEATRLISQGELQYQVGIDIAQETEFAELAAAFNTMTRSLHLSQRQLVQSAKLAAMSAKQPVAPMISKKLPPISGPTTLVTPLATCRSEIEEKI